MSNKQIARLMREEQGKPALLIDGKPVFASYMWTGTPEPEVFRSAAAAKEFAKAGVHCYAFDMGLNEWCGPGTEIKGNDAPATHFDFSKMKARFERVIDADPQARFHLRMHSEKTTADNWWLKMYPEEVEVTESDTIEINRIGSTVQPAQSYASVVWRNHAKMFLREFVHQIDSMGLSDRVIAWQTGHGYTGEGFKWSAVGQEIGDFSKPMELYFQSWLMIR